MPLFFADIAAQKAASHPPIGTTVRLIASACRAALCGVPSEPRPYRLVVSIGARLASIRSQRRMHAEDRHGLRKGGRIAALRALLAAVPLCLFSVSVFAADGGSHGASEATFLFQIIALLVCGRLMGELMQRLGQPPVMGQL